MMTFNFWGVGVTLKGRGSLSVGRLMTSSIKMNSLKIARHYEYPRKIFRFSDELGKVDEFLHHKKSGADAPKSHY